MRRIVCLGMTALLLQGCGTDLESVLQFTYPLISGDYAIGYHSPEGRFGIGKSSLTLDGTVEGDILGPNGATYTITGGLSPTMELQIDITGPDGTVDFQWLGGTVDEHGVIEGDFVLDGAESSFAGSKNNEITEGDPDHSFDGTYDLTATLGEEERGSTVFHVDQGHFDLHLIDLDDNLFEASGYVTSDGTFVLGEVSTTAEGQFLAEGNVDQESFEISGLFRLGDSVGVLSGGRAD